jgi:hypothetical protein
VFLIHSRICAYPLATARSVTETETTVDSPLEEWWRDSASPPRLENVPSSMPFHCRSHKEHQPAHRSLWMDPQVEERVEALYADLEAADAACISNDPPDTTCAFKTAINHHCHQTLESCSIGDGLKCKVRAGTTGDLAIALHEYEKSHKGESPSVGRSVFARQARGRRR